MRLSIVLCLITLVNLSVLAQSVQQRYIDQYKDIAMEEMQRTGIPASIKLAQAILESNSGRSHLAVKGNNHFGIKCGGNWEGEAVYRKDDDYHRGRLVRSCFRKYDSADESFIAHSEFLRDPKKMERYGFLFRYEPTDYKSWARGLKRAGYATNPKYPKLLIDLIERYKLYEYDQYDAMEDEVIAKRSPKIEWEEGAELPYDIVNDVKFVYAYVDETPQKIALDFQMTVDRLIKYNEHIRHPNQVLREGQRVFLQRKRASYRGKQKFHYVKEGESMFSIAQHYGLRLDKLLKKNKLEEGQEPAIGERIRLRGIHWFDTSPRLRSQKSNILPKNPKENIRPDEGIESLPKEEREPKKEDVPPTISSETIPATGTEEIAVRDSQNHAGQPEPPIRPDEHLKKRYYTVKKGDTLYRISRTFDLSLDQIKQWNQLSNNTISVGQVLRVH